MTPPKTRPTSWIHAVRTWLGFPPMWWLGKPHQVTIAPTGEQTGYLLKILHSQGVEWVDLPARTDTAPLARPDEREFAAASTALRDRGLAWVLPWDLDAHGNLTASVTTSTSGRTTP